VHPRELVSGFAMTAVPVRAVALRQEVLEGLIR
jgi:hypothetical protein